MTDGWEACRAMINVRLDEADKQRVDKMKKHKAMDNVNTVRDIFEGLSEGDRCHMANLLFKEGYVANKVTQQIEDAAETKREFDIVQSPSRALQHATVPWPGRGT